MATTTTNLGLTLPDNGEKVSRQIINTNNTLIDNAFSGVGAKIYDVTLEVSNVSGAYTGTVYDDKITASMRAIDIYAVDPSIFNDKIHVTCNAGYLTITCDDVVGTTDVTISVLKSANDPTALTSTEFDILSNRIGDLDDLTTTVKTNVVNAINEVNSGLSTANDHIAKVRIAEELSQYTSLDTFKADLLALAQSMEELEMRPIRFVFTTTVTPFVAWDSFMGWVGRIKAGGTSLYFVFNGTSNTGANVSIGYNNGTWFIKKTTST